MNILHLSDIHFGRDNPEYGIKEPFKKHDQIIKELIKCVKNLDDASKPEHIVFTGDIAWHGLTEEFAEAYEWFNELLDALNLTGKDISFCVGNHDVDWSYRCIEDSINDDSLEIINDLYKYENIYKLEPSIYAYDNFCKHMGVIPYSYPLEGKLQYSYSAGFKDIKFNCGKTVRFVALNSSMLIAQPGISEDKMWLGQEQIKSLVEHGLLPVDQDKGVDYSVVLYHHSDRFLHPNETSAYDGRCATLPLIQNYADLLLCGHTESTGRPRLVKQLGGGTLLSGGACYYNDKHFNAFSMIYLSEGKKGIAFFPFYYDNGWKDYDFMDHTLFDREKYTFEKPQIDLENATLEITGNGTRTFNIDYLTIKETEEDGVTTIEFNNDCDFMNYFAFSCKGEKGKKWGKLKVDIAPEFANFIEAIYSYNDFVDFIHNTTDLDDIEWVLKDSEGNVIFSDSGAVQILVYDVDQHLLDELRKIEFYFGVRFTLPAKISKMERKKIDVLIDLTKRDFTNRVLSSNEIVEELTLEKMRQLQNILSDNNEVYLKCKSKYVVELFGIRLNFGLITAIAGPFYVDKDDLKKKIDTYCDGDRRFIKFSGTDRLNNYIITDYNRFLKSDESIIFNELFEVNPFDFKIEV